MQSYLLLINQIHQITEQNRKSQANIYIFEVTCPQEYDKFSSCWRAIFKTTNVINWNSIEAPLKLGTTNSAWETVKIVFSFEKLPQLFLDHTENQHVHNEPVITINESVFYLSFGPSLPETRAHIDTTSRLFSSHKDWILYEYWYTVRLVKGTLVINLPKS